MLDSLETMANHRIVLFLFVLSFSSRSINPLASKQEKRAADDARVEELSETRCLGACICYEEKFIVNCSGKNYDYIPSGIPIDTKVLDLSYNEIAEVDSQLFVGMRSVVSLDLSHNSVSDIQVQPFRDMALLRLLKLNHNNIGLLRKDVFVGLDNLEELDLQYANLQLSPSGSFSHLPSLKILKLSYNLFFDLGNETFLGLSNLTELSIDGSYLLDVPMSALELVKNHLNKLSMSRSYRLTTIGGSERSVIDLPNLERLSFSYSQIKNIIGGSFAGMPNLKELDLTGNYLVALLPQTFVGVNNLSSLLLGQVPLQAFPYRAFQPIRKSLSTLYMSFFGFTELKNLSSTYDSTFLSNLKNLTFEYGSLEAIAEHSFFKNLKSLNYLRIAENGIDRIPSEALQHLKSLQVMEFSGNPISLISKGDIPDLSHLEDFELSGSELTVVETGVFEGLAGLNSLRINGNKITDISSDAFDPLANLTSMDISNNLLQEPNEEWFQRKSLKEIRLEGNPWNCNCTSLDYRAWTESPEYQAIPTLDSVQCEQPRQLRGSNLDELSSEKLTCDFGECPSTCVCVDSSIFQLKSSSYYERGVREYQSMRMAKQDYAYGDNPSFWSMERRLDPKPLKSADLTTLYIDCTSSRLTDVPDIPNSTFSLVLASNQITKLMKTDFSSLETLEVLLASDNLISEIENGTFSGSPSLLQLYLNKNNLPGLVMPGWFAGLTLLQEIRLDDNALTEISSESFSDLVSLEKLDLSHNKINQLKSDVFSSLISLEYLSLSSNNLQTIDENAFRNLTSLAYLHLYGNWLTKVPAVMVQGNPMLIYIDIGSNSLGTIGEKFLVSPTVEFLKMEDGYNPELLNGSFSGLPKLKVLRLRNSNIRNVGDYLFTVESESELMTLDLGSNPIGTVPLAALANLTNLETFSLTSAGITTLPPLKGVDTNFLPNLQTLYLTGNSITDIQANSFIASLKGLVALVTNECNLEHIPYETLKNLTKLRHLVLDKNPIRQFIGGLDLDELEQIQLSDTNALAYVSEDAFLKLTRLKRLTLFGGKLEEIPAHAFNHLENLEVLDLSNNLLQYPNEEWFSSLDPGKVKSIALHHNPWICDCNTLRYKTWLENGAEGHNEYFVDVTCESPQMYKSWKLTEVNDTNLACTSSSEVTSTPIASSTPIPPISTSIVSSTPTLSPDCTKCSYDETSKSASCSGRLLLSVPRGCFSSETKSVDLSDNLIQEIRDGDFVGLKRLEKLIMNNNRLVTISHSAFSDLKSLIYLDLSSNSLSEVPTESLSYVDGSLLTLYMDDQRILRISENSFRLPHLQELSLKSLPGNENIPLGIDDFAFAQLPQLLALDISSNAILSLSRNTFTGLRYLGRLNLANTKLNGFPEEAMRRLMQLEELILNENNIGIIGPAVFPILPELRNLFVRKSNVSTVDQDSFLKDCSELLELDLGYSLLEDIPSRAFQQLISLKILYLDHSPISKIRQSDFSSEKLSFIDLTGSKIGEVGPKAFAATRNLTRLDLKSNKITFIADDAFSTSELEYLDISNNSLTYLSCFWLDNMSPGHLHTLKLSENKYHCSCGMVGYRDFMSTAEYTSIGVVDDPKCTTPDQFSGKALGDISLGELEEFCLGDSESSPPSYCRMQNPDTSTLMPYTTTSDSKLAINGFLSFILPLTTLLLT